MCIGIPMQVTRVEPGHAICHGRGETRRARTALVGDIQAGDWVLIFLDSVQEVISEARAREVNSTLDLLATCLQEVVPNGSVGEATVGFELPSRMSRDELVALSLGTTLHH